jgi:hypothetical protein
VFPEFTISKAARQSFDNVWQKWRRLRGGFTVPASTGDFRVECDVLGCVGALVSVKCRRGRTGVRTAPQHQAAEFRNFLTTIDKTGHPRPSR